MEHGIGRIDSEDREKIGIGNVEELKKERQRKITDIPRENKIILQTIKQREFLQILIKTKIITKEKYQQLREEFGFTSEEDLYNLDRDTTSKLIHDLKKLEDKI